MTWYVWVAVIGTWLLSTLVVLLIRAYWIIATDQVGIGDDSPREELWDVPEPHR